MKAVVGEEALTDEDRLFLQFHDRFEAEFVKQNFQENRTIFDSLDKAWDLLSLFQRDKLSRIKEKTKEKYYNRAQREYNDPNQIQSV